MSIEQLSEEQLVAAVAAEMAQARQLWQQALNEDLYGDTTEYWPIPEISHWRCILNKLNGISSAILWRIKGCCAVIIKGECGGCEHEFETVCMFCDLSIYDVCKKEGNQ